MKLFVFTPYQWAYCGGALGVVAKDYDEAVSTLRAYRERDPLYGVKCASGHISKDRFNYPYDKALFIRPEEKDQAKHDTSGQWILEYEVEVNDPNGTRIVLDNWNFG